MPRKKKKAAKKGGSTKVERMRLDQLDVKTLRSLLDSKMAQLIAQRDELAGKLSQINASISDLGIPKIAPLTPGPAPELAPAASGEAPARSDRGRMTIGDTLEAILREQNQTMRVMELVAAVQARGHSRSRYLRSMVNHVLRADQRFRNVGRGRYRLA